MADGIIMSPHSIQQLYYSWPNHTSCYPRRQGGCSMALLKTSQIKSKNSTCTLLWIILDTFCLQRLPKGGYHRSPCSKQSSAQWAGFALHITWLSSCLDLLVATWLSSCPDLHVATWWAGVYMKTLSTLWPVWDYIWH